MIYPRCRRCGSGMTVRLARRGQNAGNEFWGCDEHFKTGCRGSHEVPFHEWDWFGLAPVPVRIIANQERWLAEIEANDPNNNPWLDYYETHYGVFGPYRDYDEHMWDFEQALKTSEMYLDYLAEEQISYDLSAIKRLFSERQRHQSMSECTVAAAKQYIGGSATLQAFCAWLTKHFAGSTVIRIGGHDKGVVSLDDHSLLIFSKRPSGIVLSSCRGYQHLFSQLDSSTATLSTSQFETLSGYFAKNFGLGAPARTSWTM